MSAEENEYPPVMRLKEIQDGQKQRYKALVEVHLAKHGKPPAFFARAPGRVNIIGEHIDYCGYSVLPMAIQQDIVMAVSTNTSGKICLANVNQKYGLYQTSVKDFQINPSKPEWHNYFLCGLKGIIESAKGLAEPVGMDITTDGSVPPSAGLSSSSALVCCGALATMFANNLRITKLELADICMRCEHFIGTQGGGMDQSICFLAKSGTAKLIEFKPIRATDVKLPPGVSFVISNSCVEMNKAATSDFNVRVVECRLACQILAKAKGLLWKEHRVLGELHKVLNVSFDGMLKAVDEVLHNDPYTKQEVCQILGVTEEELNKESLSANTLDVQSFKLHDRAKHVFGEAHRVVNFKEICDEPEDDATQLLGKLMNDSHYSCSTLYECSCEPLDELIQICRDAGALGSRLTGAGWGGCAVSMVPHSQVINFMAQVQAKYYNTDPARMERVTEYLFATSPGSGAVLYEYDDSL